MDNKPSIVRLSQEAIAKRPNSPDSAAKERANFRNVANSSVLRQWGLVGQPANIQDFWGATQSSKRGVSLRKHSLGVRKTALAREDVEEAILSSHEVEVASRIVT